MPWCSACEHSRHGTSSPFAALNVATGEVIGRTHRKHTHEEFLLLLRKVERFFPGLTTRHLRRSTLRSVPELKEQEELPPLPTQGPPKPFTWSASADLILGKVKHTCTELL